MADTYQRIDGELLSSELSESELVMLNVDKGNYYGCEGVAKTVWETIEQAVTVEQIVAAVGAEFPDAPETVTDEVQEFLDQLLDNELVRKTSA